MSCISKLNLLIENKNLRKQLGENARKSANGIFSWKSIISDYKDLGNELDRIRTDDDSKIKTSQFKLQADRLDPFLIFETGLPKSKF